MNRADKPQGDWITSLLGWLLGCALIGLLLGLNWLLPALFHFSKKPVSAALQLERHSVRWPAWKWLCLPLKWLAATAFLVSMVHLALQLLPARLLPTSWLTESVYLFAGLLNGLLFCVLHWLEQHHRDPQVQKVQAGRHAERYVQKIIEAAAPSYPGSRPLHGVLFVFNPGTEDEFSAEADHLLITRNRIYLLETKYKSGTVHADADAPQWQTVCTQGIKGSMRNALLQAKNSARVLKNEIPLPCPLVPVVVLHGRQTNIVGGPANVVNTVDLIKLLDAFELAQQAGSIRPEEVAAQLLQFASTDPGALARHIARAQQARLRSDRQAMVRGASID